MKRGLVLVILLGAAVFATGCAQLGPVYYKRSQEYSFHPPAEWRYNPPEEEITVFQSHHVKGHDFRPNMNIIMEDSDLVLEEYVEKQRAEWLPKLPGFEIVEEGYVRYGETWRLVYDHYNPRYKITLRALLQLSLWNNRIYALTCMAPKTIWNRYKGTFYDSLDTLKFGKDAVPIGEETDAYSKPELRK
jgi:hypothetical protein